MSAPLPTVLVIEDEPQMRRFLRATLENHEYRMIDAPTAQQALAEASTRSPDIVLLDLGLPDIDGIEVLERLREWTQVPVIVVSARDQEEQKIRALDAGADDYLTKPFGAGELLARIRVALRHADRKKDGADEPVFKVGDLEVDFAKRLVFVAGRAVHLTPTEYKLLTVLLRSGGKVVTHRHLLKEVWGMAFAEHTHYLRVFMAQLRHKLETDPARPRYLLTEPGVGYRVRVT
jgi:two-component system, OmpR family, KDP operon response regulator KdpE